MKKRKIVNEYIIKIEVVLLLFLIKKTIEKSRRITAGKVKSLINCVMLIIKLPK